MNTRLVRTAAILTLALSSLAFADHVALEADGQEVRGTTITLDRVELEQDGFVVVHATDTAGDVVLTPPLGLTYLEAGEHMDVAVELDTDLLDEYGYGAGPKAVVPMLHVDANEDGAYQFPDGGDVPVMADGGALVSPLELSMPEMGRASVATGSGALEVDGDGVFVTLPSVTLTQPGFVVLHAANDDGSLRGLPVLGASEALPAGTSDDVMVRIEPDQAPLVGDDVFAMVHVDDGDGAYRFPQSDAPFAQDGDVLVEPFTLN